MFNDLENQNPVLYEKCAERNITSQDEDDEIVDVFDAREIFGMNFKLNVFIINVFNAIKKKVASCYHPIFGCNRNFMVIRRLFFSFQT